MLPKRERAGQLMSTSSVETSPVPDAPPASASVQSGPSDTSNSAAAPPQGSVVSNSDSAEISATALHGAVDRQRQVAYNVLKRVTCTFIIVTPIVAVPFLDDGVNAASTLTEVVVPIAGSFVFLLLIASFLTFGGRYARNAITAVERARRTMPSHALSYLRASACTQPPAPLCLEYGRHLRGLGFSAAGACRDRGAQGAAAAHSGRRRSRTGRRGRGRVRALSLGRRCRRRHARATVSPVRVAQSPRGTRATNTPPLFPLFDSYFYTRVPSPIARIAILTAMRVASRARECLCAALFTGTASTAGSSTRRHTRRANAQCAKPTQSPQEAARRRWRGRAVLRRRHTRSKATWAPARCSA